MKKRLPKAALSPSPARRPSPPATRLERDTMGELAVPATAYYGVRELGLG